MLRLLCLLACVYIVLSQNGTIVDVLRTKKETTLLVYLNRTGLLSALEGPGPYSLFAPSNSAFSQVDHDTRVRWRNASYLQELTDYLKYHVVSGNITSADLHVNEKQLTSLLGPKIRVNYYRTVQHMAVEGAMVSTTNLHASNGIVHIISRVMQPPNGTIVDILMRNPEFSALANLVQASGLTNALKDGPYTLFAPNNDALSKLTDVQLQKIQADPSLLQSILLYHVVHGTLYTTGMHATSLHNLEETDSDRLISYVRNGYQSTGTFLLDGITHSTRNVDISATNGVIHTIDHVLIPASARTILAAP